MSKAILKSNREFASELHDMVMDYEMQDDNNCCFYEYHAHVKLLDIEVRVSMQNWVIVVHKVGKYKTGHGINLDSQINKAEKEKIKKELADAMNKAVKIR